MRDVLKAKVVTAKCQAGEDGLTGSSSIAELTVLGQKIDVTAKADINVLGVATVKLNEQFRRGNTLTVNAVHVTVGGAVRGITSADIVLSQAKCSASGADTPTTPPGPSPTTSEPTQSTQSEEPGPMVRTRSQSLIMVRMRVGWDRNTPCHRHRRWCTVMDAVHREKTSSTCSVWPP